MRISDWSSDVCSSDLPLQLSRFVQKGCKMPKLKNKSGAKKRFRISGSGKVIASFAGKRHGMRKRPQKMIRNARGTAVLCDADTKIVRRKFLIYATQGVNDMARQKQGQPPKPPHKKKTEQAK